MNLTITFTYDPGGANETTVTLPAPMRGYEQRQERSQAVGQTADGTHYIYDKETVTRYLTLTLRCDRTQKNALDNFFENTVKGALNTFKYVDHYGESHTSCRFAEPKLTWTKTAGRLHETTFDLVVNESVQ